MLVILLIIITLHPINNQMDPSWIRDVNIDAGESKPINFDKCRTSSTPAVVLPNLNSSIFNYTQAYNKTDFKSVPKVALAQLSYDFFYVANPQMGYRITLIQSSITNTSFRYTIQIVGVKVCGLHFMYIAVQRIYDPFYLIQVYPLSFNTSDSARDISGGNPRVQTLRINYPNNYILSNGYSSSNYALQAWILSYVFYSNSSLSINLTSSIYSTTQFELNIRVSDNFSIGELKITTVLIDRIKILEYSYSIYIDQIYNNQPGNFQMNQTNLTTITDFATQYFYRNTLSGLTANSIIFHNNLTYFYSFQSSSNNSLFTGYGINLRTRNCSNASLPYYFYQTMKCITVCPTYYYSNTTYKYCIKCHYSCQNCNAPASSNICSSCQAAKFRQLVNSSICSCMDHYFDNGTVLCADCHTTCLQCSNQLSNGCLGCDSTLKRTLINTTCLCMDGYYQNTTCMACHNYCLTCSYNTTQICLTCNSTNNRTLDNTKTTCLCLPAYYQVIQNCQPCDIGCLNCTGPSLCTLCNLSAHFTLQSGNCQCKPSYTLINSTCILSTATCGNGIIQLSQQCDDDNLINGDGCSSQCTIQQNYTCINNASLYAYSLCYYSGNIQLNLTYVYKVPLQNTVQLIMAVAAGNINQTALKIYLQTQTALTFQSKTRLLSPSAIIQQTFTYDIPTSKLTVVFNYNSDIDLSTLSLEFKPSLSSSNNARHFYATPSTAITLTVPNNKLLTTYLQPNDLSKQQTISWVFLVIIILSWLYLIIAIAYKQSAMALQFFMVLQVTYQSLLQSGFIYDGWIGLVFFGKYTYGVNVGTIISTQLDALNIIGLTIPLINILNITIGICLLAVLTMLSIFIYQKVQKSKQQQQQVLEPTKTNNKIELGRQTTVQFNHSSYQLKKNIFVICMQTTIVCVFITFRIFIISCCLAIKQSVYNASSLFPLLAITVSTIIVFIVYYKFYDYQAMADLSYRRLLSNPIKSNKQTNCRTLLSNYLLKYHYLNIFILMSIFAIVNSLSSIGTGMYLGVAMGALIWWVVIAINGNYLRKLHKIRAAINTICLMVTMITLLLQTLNILNPSQNTTAPLIGLSLLFISLVFNTTVLIRIEYKRKRKMKYQLQMIDIRISQVNKTDLAAIEPNQEDRNHNLLIDQSLVLLTPNIEQKQKSEHSVSNVSSRQATAAKIIQQNASNTRTQHKKYNKLTIVIDQTAKIMNINEQQQKRQQPKDEYNDEQGQMTSKEKIAKQLDFQQL